MSVTRFDGRVARFESAWGIALAALLAIVALLLAAALGRLGGTGGHAPVSPVLCAILLGVGWRNTLGLDSRLVAGLEWVTHSLLRVGIALVGLKLALGSMGSVALFALPVVIGCIATALLVSSLVGRLLGLPQSLRLLLAAGTSVCGCTAIVATSPVSRASPVETSIAITCIVVLGCAGMLAYPWLAHSLFAGSAQAAGVFLGTSIPDTSQVLGAAMIHGQQFNVPEAAPVAAFTKMLRNLSLLVLVPLFAYLRRREDVQYAAAGTAPAGSRPAPKRSQILPTFLLWFVALAILRTLGDAYLAGTALESTWSGALLAGSKVSELLLVCGMAAIGLGVALRDLKAVGGRALAATVLVVLSIGAASVGLTSLMLRLA
jgi:uncharacterized integral membrane protein (TIGR00698 family)